ncbi:hypothetical protein MBLNU459_g3033t1 [Dothideomycetes sp. NU459]
MAGHSRGTLRPYLGLGLFSFFSASLFRDVAAHSYSSETNANSTSYDYVIVGGGLTGLVVANRLTEDPSKNVLVVEYGHIDNSSTTLTPYDADGLNTADMYNIISAPQPGLDNQSFPVWIGAAVGGGSLVNGMEFDRGAAADYDAWGSLGNAGWDWEGLFPYFKKSSTFTPPGPASFVEENGITWNLSAYGEGPLQASIAPYQYPELPTFWKAWRELGVPTPIEGADGHAIGAFWTASSLDAKTMTRSSARTAYYDPVASRPNLHLLTGHTVTEILFRNLTAYGVKMTNRADNTSSLAHATKEVILAAGAIHTPQLLQLSGIGPRDVLEAAGVKVRLDLPAVGVNFQDHPAAYLNWNLTKDNYFPNSVTQSVNATYNASAYVEYLENRTGPFTLAHGNSGCFLSLPELTNSSDSIISTLKSQNATAYLPSAYSRSSSILAGFKAQRALLASLYASTNSSVYEFPFSGSGRGTNALQKPVSRGTITLNASDPHAAPVVDYHALQNPVDAAIIVAMVRYTRRFFATAAMSVFAPVELTPGPAAQSDDQILAALRAGGVLQPSFANPCASCAMMPRDLGGCVSSRLEVYGTRNLRVVDASIIPLHVGAHLQETMYAVAEKAADLIKASSA